MDTENNKCLMNLSNEWSLIQVTNFKSRSIFISLQGALSPVIKHVVGKGDGLDQRVLTCKFKMYSYPLIT